MTILKTYFFYSSRSVCKKKCRKITDKIKEKAGVVDSLSKFKKFTKLGASYIEYDLRVEIKLMGPS
jgi:hypothetical protein